MCSAAHNDLKRHRSHFITCTLNRVQVRIIYCLNKNSCTWWTTTSYKCQNITHLFVQLISCFEANQQGCATFNITTLKSLGARRPLETLTLLKLCNKSWWVIVKHQYIQLWWLTRIIDCNMFRIAIGLQSGQLDNHWSNYKSQNLDFPFSNWHICRFAPNSIIIKFKINRSCDSTKYIHGKNRKLRKNNLSVSRSWPV